MKRLKRFLMELQDVGPSNRVPLLLLKVHTQKPAPSLGAREQRALSTE